MQLNMSVIGSTIGIILMVGFGNSIARHIGVESWQLTGFATGLLLIAIAPAWDLRRRLKIVEAQIEAGKSQSSQ